jgi:Protein of unknown function (DUF1566)
VAGASLPEQAQSTAEARLLRRSGIRERALGRCVVGLVLWGAPGAWAGDGAAALQAADSSCRDNSTNIYVDCGNGTVTDNRTGLVWLKNANCLIGGVDWYTAREFVAGLSDQLPTSAAAAHDCGLSDGSSPGEWRLPSVAEWEAMVANALGEGGDPDCVSFPPTITNDSGLACWDIGPSSFSSVVLSFYWSSTTSASSLASASGMSINLGTVGTSLKVTGGFVWPVRGGQ